MTEKTRKELSLTRRDLLGTTAKVATLAGAGAGLAAGAAGLHRRADPRRQARAGGHRRNSNSRPASSTNTTASGRSGQSGELRILGVPSMRELMRVPVFNRCSRHRLGPDQREPQDPDRGPDCRDARTFWPRGRRSTDNGDLHHPHMSFTDGTYDGRYLFMNDKANTRVARVRCDVMKCDKIIEIPNAHDIHGLRPQKFPRTGYVFANGEHRVPMPNDGMILDEPEKYVNIFTAIDGDEHESRLAGDRQRQSRQLRLPTIRANTPSRPATTPRMGVTLAEMTANEQDWAVIFNIARSRRRSRPATSRS